jgi:hypothetical protein
MKRYMLFTGATYYPSGGWRDFNSDHDSMEQALDAAEDFRREREYGCEGWRMAWANIADAQTGGIVWEDGKEKP